jgi:hypothetical protein
MKNVILEFDANINDVIDTFSKDKEKTYDFILKFLNDVNRLSNHFTIEIVIKKSNCVLRVRTQ